MESLLKSYYEKLLQNSGIDSEKVKKAMFYLDGRIDELYKRINELLGEKTNVLKTAIVEKKKEVPYFATEVIERDDITIKQNETFMDLKGRGFINQIFCKADDHNFGIFIMLDGKLIFEKPYHFFLTMENDLDNISAYENYGQFFLSMKQFGFLKSAMIRITSENETYFENIIIQYILYPPEKIEST